jgi:hypothetical protein
MRATSVLAVVVPDMSIIECLKYFVYSYVFHALKITTGLDPISYR